jgi:hypothetical protein
VGGFAHPGGFGHSLLGLGLALGECVPLSPAARVAHNNHGEQAGGSLWFVRI